MRTDSVMNPGRLHLLPKHRYHVTGDGDDGTTTRHGKALAMAQGIDLRSPAATSMRRHKRRRRIVINAAWAVVTVAIAGLALHWMTV